MSEPNSFASLGPTLLARKGGAKPAMRSQWNAAAAAAAAAKPADETDENYVHTQDDLGWNDMGEDHDSHSAEVLALTPAEPGEHYADEEGEEEDSTPTEERSAVESILGKREAANTDTASPEAPAAEKPEARDKSVEAPTVSEVPEVLRRQHSIHAQLAAAGTDRGPLQVKQPKAKDGKDTAEQDDAKRDDQAATEPEAKIEAKVEAKATPPAPASNDTGDETGKAEPRGDAPKVGKRGARAAFTLRLDRERHLKLRLACTVKDCSAQQLVTEALDKFLGEISEVSALTAQLKKD